MKYSNIHLERKAIVVVAGSFRLYQAIYLTYLFPEYIWDVVVIAYGEREDISNRLIEICKKTGRFNNIYKSNTPTQFSLKSELLIECVKMVIYYLTGRKAKYAKSLIEKSIGILDYELACVACSYSLLEGAFLCLNRKMEVIVMEEGLDDYVGQKMKYSLFKTIGAHLLFRMQYINLLLRNDYKPLQYSEKYVRYPQLIRENLYAKVNKMLDYTKIDYKSFYSTISTAFEIGEENYDLVIYTDPLWQYGIEKEYVSFVKYVSNKYHGLKVLLKRHPQDTYYYDFEGVDVEEKYLEVPGELVMKRWSDAVHIFSYPSTILLGAELENYKYEVIYFTQVKNETYNKVFKELVDFLNIPIEKVVEL